MWKQIECSNCKKETFSNNDGNTLCLVCEELAKPFKSKAEQYEKALKLIQSNFHLPSENTDLIPIEVLYEIQLIVKKALEK